ncbi:MAG TPA: efflux RND transporter periplasmic adaptor subunit [Lacipirellulaceae bacterium]|nr:efflux RND transporter periplasmic adaptor subunit [Lacipirellulaceae bacterium]
MTDLIFKVCLSGVVLFVFGTNGLAAEGAEHRANPTSGGEVEVESVVLRLFEEAEVPAQESGVVMNVGVQEGQRVKEGDLLAQVDDQVPRLAADAAKAKYDITHEKATNDVKIRYAQKALEVSEAELKRSTESIEKFAKSVSQSQLDVDQLTVQKNRLETEEAAHEQAIAVLEMRGQENELNAAKAQIARRRIVAPFDGVIVQVYLRKGEWAEPGQKALRIVNTDRLKAEGFIRAEDAAAVAAGKTVQVTVDMGDKPQTFAGKIAFVSPEVDPITGQVRIWAEVENRDGHLRPGLAARMRVGG